MSWQTFTIQMVRYGSWPFVVLVLGIMFKWQILELIGRIRELSIFGVSAKLRKKVKKFAEEARGKAQPPAGAVERSSETIDPPNKTATEGQPQRSHDPIHATLATLLSIATSSPNVAAEAAWELLVAELRGLMASHLVTVNMLVSPYAMSLMLLSAGFLEDANPVPDKTLPEVIADAQAIAGQIANGGKLDADQAASYISGIGDLITRIRWSVVERPPADERTISRAFSSMLGADQE